MPRKLFDLNIQENFLSSWTPRDAIRELLANAIDEAMLTGSPTPEITKVTDGAWEIRDWGRGLRPEHLTQDENQEKANTDMEVIGRFGVGLKDALATLRDANVGVEILSPHARYTLVTHGKSGFQDVPTLHVDVDVDSAWAEKGTLVRLTDVGDDAVRQAKALFLRFQPLEVLDSGRYGQILARDLGHPAGIYVRGLRIADEADFLFSYNITALTKKMRDALNRERTNVGRTGYSERVKSLLKDSMKPEVAERLAKDLRALSRGEAHAEVTNWTDVAIHACKVLNQMGKVVFVDALELERERQTLDEVRRDGGRVVPIPTKTLGRLRRETFDYQGSLIRTLGVVADEIRASYRFDFVDESDLDDHERSVWELREVIEPLVGGRPEVVKEILLSNTMRPELGNRQEVLGLWEPEVGRIIVKRSQLRDLAAFAGTLAHELAHAQSGKPDVSRDFEKWLTLMLGAVLSQLVKSPIRPPVQRPSAPPQQPTELSPQPIEPEPLPTRAEEPSPEPKPRRRLRERLFWWHRN